jgi:DNA-binding transcriptional LysR family regulator
METPRSNLYQLAVFLEVAERQSLTRAAETFMVSQPVVSRIVKLLEREYGIELMGRDGNKVIPTAAGDAVAQFAREALDAERSARARIRQLQDWQRGRLRVGITGSAYSRAQSFLTQFYSEYPEAEITFVVGSSVSVADKVRDDELDAAIVIAAPAVVHHLRATPLWRERLVPVVAPDSPLLEDASDVSALRELTIVTTATASHLAFTTTHLLPLLPQGYDYPIVPGGTEEFVRQIVHEGRRVALLPLIAVEDDLRLGRLALWDLGDNVHGEISLVTDSRAPITPLLRAFRNELTQLGATISRGSAH